MPRCKLNYQKWYKNNLQKMVDRTREIHQYRIKLIGRWKQFKGCSMCGFKTHRAALDLDHINDNSTKASSGNAIRYTWSIKKIKKELSKCQVLCSNCHRIKTHNQMWRKDKPVSVRS